MKRVVLILSLLNLLIFSGCYDKASISKPSMQKAQDLLLDGDYKAAYNMYVELIPKIGDEAVIGAGWASLREGNVEIAIAHFEQIQNDNWLDVHAGLSFCYWVLGDFYNSIKYSENILSKDQDYRLTIDSRITSYHIILLMSTCYFQLGDYISCVESIRAIKGQENYDPDIQSPEVVTELGNKLLQLGGVSVLD